MAKLSPVRNATEIISEIREQVRITRSRNAAQDTAGGTINPPIDDRETVSIPAPAACVGTPYTATMKFGLCPYADAGLTTVGVFPLGGITWCGP